MVACLGLRWVVGSWVNIAGSAVLVVVVEECNSASDSDSRDKILQHYYQ